MEQITEQTLIKRFFQIDWALVFLICLISCIGFAMLYSAAGGSWDPWALKQLIRFFIGLLLMIMIAITPIQWLLRYAYPFFYGCIALLVVVELIGFAGGGAQRWVNLGVVNVQPSEFMKLAVILALARYFHSLHPDDINRLPFLVPPILMVLIPAGLVFLQPNLGTASIIVMVGGVVFFMAGVYLRYFAIVITLGFAALPVAWQLLHGYQKQRVLTFLNPESDPLGAGYNIMQSMIAIGSGGMLGKGFLQGSQSQLDFLPEKHTDFIFTTLAEEFGLIGSSLVLISFGAILVYGMLIALKSRSQFGALISMGISAMLFVHIMINVAMVMGMVPVVGVPLPLLSYGGTIMITMLMGFGLMLNAHVHRETVLFRSYKDL